MTGPADRPCPACQRLAGILPVRGLARWCLVTDPDHHYLATEPARRRLQQSLQMPMIRALVARLDAIAAAGRVAWVDLDARGAFIVVQAPHGEIPMDLPPTLRRRAQDRAPGAAVPGRPAAEPGSLRPA